MMMIIGVTQLTPSSNQVKESGFFGVTKTIVSFGFLKHQG